MSAGNKEPTRTNQNCLANQQQVLGSAVCLVPVQPEQTVTKMLGQNHFAELNWHILTFVHPIILLCWTTYRELGLSARLLFRGLACIDTVWLGIIKMFTSKFSLQVRTYFLQLMLFHIPRDLCSHHILLLSYFHVVTFGL